MRAATKAMVDGEVEFPAVKRGAGEGQVLDGLFSGNSGVIRVMADLLIAGKTALAGY